MDPRFVHVMRLGHEMVDKKHELFKGRTSMFTDELKNGNISLKLSNIQLSDQGKYRCFIPEQDRQAFVQLVCVSAAALPPVVTLSGLDGQSGGVVLQCESAGWYPEPEVLWLDAEGKLLSAGPPETVRGPDDLYTVSSRVTVEKRPSNSFTCRVQHHNTNMHTMQTQINFPDDFSMVPCSCSASIAVSVLFGFMFFLTVVLFVWKWRKNIETKRNHTDEADKETNKNLSKAEDQCVTEEERGPLMTPETVQIAVKQLFEEQKRVEAEKKVKTLKEELETKKREVESKQSELQDLHAEKQRNGKELQILKEDLENKKRELEVIRNTSLPLLVPKYKEKKNKAKQEVETLEKELETQQKTTDTNIREFEVKEAEVQRLQEEIQRMETSLQTNNMEEHTKKDVEPDTSHSKEPNQTICYTQDLYSGFIIEVNTRQSFCLKNTFHKDQQLGGWELKLQFNKSTPFTYTFEDSFKLNAGGDVTITHKRLSNNPADLVWEDLKFWNPGDKLQFSLCSDTGEDQHIEHAKKDVEPDTSHSKEPNQTICYTQDSHSGFIIEVHERKSFCLKNMYHEDQQLGGWELTLQFNKSTPFTYTFEDSFKLNAGGDVTITRKRLSNDPADLVWEDLKFWKTGDKLQFSLCSDTKEDQHIVVKIR
ncbi:hypothetical protein OYC64_001156 [Pagothenia borchgrevinki]|uniref:Ig-like domain-containing protein n=1 Tax=Pagothenia borchgrevinki TaxID=8213 RepID=A0ABD2GAV7_PAGBO